MSRADAYGAVARCDGYGYEPEGLTIVTDKGHPLYDERVNLPLDEQLVQSIMAHGVLEPIIVRKNGCDKKGNPIIEVIDGRQRVRCCAEANRRLAEVGGKPKRVPAVVKSGTGEEAMGWMITTNEIRFEDTPLTKAKKLRRYLDAGYSEQDARVTFGLDARAMRNLLMLLSCSATVQKALEKEQLAVSVARDLSALPEAEQDAKLAEFAAAGVLSLRSPKAAASAKEAKGDRGRRRKAPKYHLRPAKTVAASFEALEARKDTLSDKAQGFLLAMRWMLGDDEALRAFAEQDGGYDALRETT